MVRLRKCRPVAFASLRMTYQAPLQTRVKRKTVWQRKNGIVFSVGVDVLDGNPQKLTSSLSGNPYDCPNNETIYERRNLIVKKATKTLFSPRKGRIVAELHALFIKYCIYISFLFSDSRRGSPKASFRAFGGSRRGRLSLQI